MTTGRIFSVAIAATLLIVILGGFLSVQLATTSSVSADTEPASFKFSALPDDTPNRDQLDAEALRYFRSYVQFDTTNPPSNTAAAIAYLKDLLSREGIETATFESKPGMVTLVARLPGDVTEKPFLMMSHADVVPAVANDWKHPPFSAEIVDGYVWGRGTIDNKAHGIMALMTMIALKREGVRLHRGVEMMVTPDEEAGGEWGAKWIVDKHFESIDPAFAVNEGGGGGIDSLGSKMPGFGIAVTEKKPLWLHLTAKGISGHASIPSADNPNLILVNGLSRLMAMNMPTQIEPMVAENLSASGAYEPFPASFELAHLNWPFMLEIAFRGPLNSPNMRAAMHDTMSITILAAGSKVNVIPSTAEADVDCRLLPGTKVAAFMRRVRNAVGPRISIEARLKPTEAKASPTRGPLWDAIGDTIAADFPNMGYGPSMTTAVTDSRFLRARGVPTYGFVPMVLTASDAKGIHGVDERLSIENFNRGLRATYDMTKELCAEKPSKSSGMVAAR